MNVEESNYCNYCEFEDFCKNAYSLEDLDLENCGGDFGYLLKEDLWENWDNDYYRAV